MSIELPPDIAEVFLPRKFLRKIFYGTLFIIALCMLIRTLYGTYKQSQTAKWIETRGVVIEKSYKTIKEETTISYQPSIIIQHLVDKTIYKNQPSEINNDTRSFSDRYECEAFLQKLDSSNTKIYYNPVNPHEFVLNKGIQTENMFPILSIEIVLMAFSVYLIRSKESNSEVRKKRRDNTTANNS